MLVWGVAAVIPILIHFWNRRQHQETTWAAMEFLLAASRKNARRLALERWILLILRISIVLLFALALTDVSCDWSSPLGSLTVAKASKHTVIVIDVSYSMDYRHDELTSFQLARQAATDLVQSGGQGDGYSVVLMADNPVGLIEQPAYDKQGVIEELEEVQLQHAGGDLLATLEIVKKALDLADQEKPPLEQTSVYFLTDLGKTTWADSNRGRCQSEFEQIAERAEIVVWDVGQQVSDNLAITDLRQSDSIVTTARDVLFEADICHLGSTSRSQHEVRLYVNGQVVEKAIADITPASQTTVTLSHRFDQPGEYDVEVRLGEDRLSVDNHRWLAIPVREEIRVLCVQGKVGSAKFVEFALRPDDGGLSRIQCEVVPETAVLEADLKKIDVLFLCNLGNIDNNEAGVLRQFVEGGGGLVVFLGDQVVSENYNSTLAAIDDKLALLPAELGEPVATGQYYLDPHDYQHPVVRPFRGNEKAGLLTTPIWKYIRLTPHDLNETTTALWFDTQDPAIVERRVGNGRSILVAIPASTESIDRLSDPPTPWTAISSWHSFPPLVHELLNLAISGRFESRNVLVGQSLGSFVSTVSSEAAFDVVDPLGQTEKVRLRFNGRQNRWFYGETFQQGIYEAQIPSTRSSSQKFAVNVNTQESLSDRMDFVDLPSQLRQYRENKTGIELESGGMEQQAVLFRQLLCLLLLLLSAELYWAYWIGSATA